MSSPFRIRSGWYVKDFLVYNHIEKFSKGRFHTWSRWPCVYHTHVNRLDGFRQRATSFVTQPFDPFFINAYHVHVSAPKYLSNSWRSSGCESQLHLFAHLFIIHRRRLRESDRSAKLFAQLPVEDISRTKPISRYSYISQSRFYI